MMTTADMVIETSQMARITATVPRWLTEVPLYQRLAPGVRCPEQAPDFLHCFQSLPLISKREIRHEFPLNFIPAGVDLESLIANELVEIERTSGTTEEPIPLLLAQGWWPEQEQKALRLNQRIDRTLTSTSRRVTIASPVCTSEISYKGTPTCVERTLGSIRFVNLSRYPFLWTDSALERMAEETLEWAPDFLDVDPVYGLLFALYCERQGIRLPTLQFILSSYEFLSVTHRRVLQRVFGVPVFDLYGSTETGHLLMEDEHGEMVPSLTTAFLELVNVDAVGIGELVVTTLTNEYMPLIRYRIGDLARRTQRPHQATFELHGRKQDAVKNTRGGRVTVAQVDQCLDGLEGIAHYQLRQESPQHFTFFAVPDAAPATAATLELLHSRLAGLLETEKGLVLRTVDYLPCESSGKFRLCCASVDRCPDGQL